VQGINDLVTPFMTVFLLHELRNTSINELFAMPGEQAEEVLSTLGDDILANIEADTYWCFSKLLDSIQDYYTFAQRGLQKTLQKLSDIVQRMDPSLHKHLQDVGLDYTHFAFRWFNCVLMRELPMHVVIRLWDTYLCEGDAFPTLHVYVCATLLCGWSSILQSMDFGEIMIFLQNPPTSDMAASAADELLSKGFLHQQLYEGAQAHLK
jgi:hypothetical protein